MMRRGGDFQARKVAARTVELEIERIGARGDGDGGGGRSMRPSPCRASGVSARAAGERADLVRGAARQPGPGSSRRARTSTPAAAAPLQHWASAPYLAWKAAQIGGGPGACADRDGDPADRRFAPPGIAAGASPCTRAPAGRGEARLGYKMRGSWTLVEIAVCPIADPRLQAALPGLRRLAAPFLEHAKSAPTPARRLDRRGPRRRRDGGGAAAAAASPADARLRAAEAAQAMDAARRHPGGRDRLPGAPAGGSGSAAPWSPCRPAPSCRRRRRGRRRWRGSCSRPSPGAGRVADLFCGCGAFALRLAEHAPGDGGGFLGGGRGGAEGGDGRGDRAEGRGGRGARPLSPAHAGAGAEGDGRGGVRPAPGRRRPSRRPRSPPRPSASRSASPATPPPSPATPASWSTPASPWSASCRSTSSCGPRTWSWSACSDGRAPGTRRSAQGCRGRRRLPSGSANMAM